MTTPDPFGSYASGDHAPRSPAVVVVIPCYNEAERLDRDAMRALAAGGRVDLLFVDDGSLDATAAVLAELTAGLPSAAVVELADNVGKGEAVRHGLRHAIASGAVEMVGYLDADLATPGAEMLRLVDALCAQPGLHAALGSRVARLGSTINRSPIRHYLGRFFASAASIALGCRVYDTQCGAKLFRVTPALIVALERPFRSPWAFDVELLDRLFTGDGSVSPVPAVAIVEVPVDVWTERGGSRLDPIAMVNAFAVVLTIIARRARRQVGARWASTRLDRH